jgi:hypothetical protein
MPKYHFERSSTLRAFFRVGSSCWPLLKTEIELLPQPGFAPLLRGWFYGRMCVPTYAIGELVFVRDAYTARTPHVAVALVEEVLGIWRHEFTSALNQVPHVWTGPSVPAGAQVESLEELKKLLGGLDGAAVADVAAVAVFRDHGASMRARQVLVAWVIAAVLMIGGLLTALVSWFADLPDLTRLAFFVILAGAALRGGCYLILRREEKRLPRNAVPPSGVSCSGFLDVGSPVLAPSGNFWWRAEVVAVLSRDRVIVRFDGASAFWDQTYARSALQEPKKS